MSDDLRRTLVQAVVLGLVAAVVVWFLEDFNRRRLVDDWTRFVDGWAGPKPAGFGESGGLGEAA